MFGYRINALFGEGEAFRKDSELKRRLFSVAGDVRPFTRTTIEGLYSYYNVVQRGFPGWFTFGRANNRRTFVMLPTDAPDPDVRLRPGVSGLDLHTRITQGRVKHDFSTAWHLSAACSINEPIAISARRSMR